MPQWDKSKEGDLGFWWIGQGGKELQIERHPAGDKDTFIQPLDERAQKLVRRTDSWVVYQMSDDPTQSRVCFKHYPARGPTITVGWDYTGLISVTVGDDSEAYVRTSTDLSSMPRSVAYKKQLAPPVGELPSVAETPSFTPQVEILKVGEGEGFYTAIVKPHGFDPKKKYPVIVDVYGGPDHQVVLQAMRNWLIDQWLADQGFIVVAIDGRGTPNRGRDWERAIYKKFGSVPLDDQVAGIKALAAKVPQMDMDRVGITGWSFGGYMSALAVMKRPDVFKAAVAGAPVVDWLDYDTHYTERYLGLPDKDPEAYKEASLLTYAADLKRPLLIVHGTTDDNVFFRHSLKLSDALFRAGKDFETAAAIGVDAHGARSSGDATVACEDRELFSEASGEANRQQPIPAMTAPEQGRRNKAPDESANPGRESPQS